MGMQRLRKEGCSTENMDHQTRARIIRRYRVWNPDRGKITLDCAICGEPITTVPALHHWLVRRRKKHSELLDVPENLVPTHNETCHLTEGHTKEAKAKILVFAAKRLTATAIGEWYVSLWREHGLTVPTGIYAPMKAYPIYEGRRFYDLGMTLLGNVPQPRCRGYDIRDMAFAKITGRGYKFRGAPRVELSATAECIEEGYWLKYLRSIL